MASNIKPAVDFFSNEAKEILRGLEAEDVPQWGKMTPQHMVEHLIVIFKLSIGRIKVPIVTKEEDWPKTKAYLMADSPMKRNVGSPNGNNELQDLRLPNFTAAVNKLEAEIDNFLNYVKEKPEQIADHPFGGPMTAEEWLLFHRKHFKHHFIQFNLIPDYEKS